ncbi:MAG: glycosyltransferase family 4 protein, partial [Candidatus Methanofastidiosa archaeon]|nr:glycosyltransferase family 4 protein [Candidatus Methanofastidiosa archaeon]
MKICVVCLTNKGGMIHYASQLSNSLSKENNVFFITSQGFRDVDYFNKSIQIQTVPLHPKNIFSLFWIRFDILISIIDKINPDIIHVTKEHPLLVPLLFRIKKPIVLTLHDVTKHPGDKDFLGTFKIASWLFIKRSQKIFVHGTTLKNELIKGGVTSEKIVIIPHADYSFFRKYTTTPISTDFGESQNTALFFGRISKYKGLKYLIDAVPIISKYIAN